MTTMSLFRSVTMPSVSKCGAVAGCILRGSGLNNQGLRLRVSQDQAGGNEGAIKGAFVLLDAGDNIHTQSLGPLLGQLTDAATVSGIIRRVRRGCVNVVNANILVLENP